jgi:hypothetical protein
VKEKSSQREVKAEGKGRHKEIRRRWRCRDDEEALAHLKKAGGGRAGSIIRAEGDRLRAENNNAARSIMPRRIRDEGEKWRVIM